MSNTSNQKFNDTDSGDHSPTSAESLRHQLANMRVRPKRLGPLIAFVGCDGAGKSTVSDAVLAWMQQSRTAQSCHLGIQSKALGERLARLPIVGTWLGRLIAANSPKGNPKGLSGGKGLTTLAALAIFLLSIRRWRRYQKMMVLRRQGVAIVADRFPQLAVANMKIDGPGLMEAEHRNGFVRFLAGCERTLYAYMVSYRPTLVIRLNVDLETAFARKPDHRYESLALKISHVPQLEYQGAPVLDLDSCQPLDEVVAQAISAVSAHLANY